MAVYKIIMVIFFIFLTLGCKEMNLPKALKTVKTKQPKAKEINIAQEDAVYLLKELRRKNPFRPDHATGIPMATDLSSNVLKGIMWDVKSPHALIGGNVVVVGDIVDGKEIIRINRDSVVLKGEAGEMILKLEEFSR